VLGIKGINRSVVVISDDGLYVIDDLFASLEDAAVASRV
jgi:hypothetical protein